MLPVACANFAGAHITGDTSPFSDHDLLFTSEASTTYLHWSEYEYKGI